MKLYQNIDTCPMYQFSKATDGDLSALIQEGKPTNDKDIERLQALYDELSGDLADIVQDKQQDFINRSILHIETLRTDLMIYESCINILGKTSSDNMRTMLNNSIFGINIPENYTETDLETAFNKLGKLRNDIARKEDEMREYISKTIGRNESSKSNAVDAFYESMTAINRWNGFRNDPQQITMREYGISLRELRKESERVKKNKDK